MCTLKEHFIRVYENYHISWYSNELVNEALDILFG